MPSIISSVRQHLPTTCGTGRLSPAAVQSNGDVRDSMSNSPFYELCKATVRRASRKDFSSIYNRTTDERAARDLAKAGMFYTGQAASDLPLSCTVDREHPDFDYLKDEAVRLSTFYDWPERAVRIVKPRDLAKAGMFYTGQADRVQCAFCHGYLRNWLQGDDPAEEHRRHFPDCSLVRNADIGTFDIVDNVRSSNQVFFTFNNYVKTTAWTFQM